MLMLQMLVSASSPIVSYYQEKEARRKCHTISLKDIILYASCVDVDADIEYGERHAIGRHRTFIIAHI